VLFTSGLGNIGVDELMDFIVDYTPAASEHHAITGWTAGGAEPASRKGTDNEPASVYVFKTTSDAFAGRISYFKVFSGVLKNDASLQNYNRNTQEKFAHISLVQGKQAVPINEIHAGDIGAVAKLRETLTGDTLGDKASPIRYPAVQAARAGHHLRHRAEEPRRRRQAGRGPPQADGRRRHAALLPRSRRPRNS
jgi:elongation factor G